ncbi:MAG: gamma-glutamylcyclotransferase family protein [Opitutaceae bacterium]|nr:gamma-glutamylcyclotransferase family protein [Opitutaceae bacterium]
MKLLFVYGTLKRGASNHEWLSGQAFIAEARTTPGFRLFDVGGYPGLVRWTRDQDGVAGEIWSVDDECLKRLDEFEGLAEGLYRREPVPLLPPFAAQPIDAYFYPHSVLGRPEVGSVWRG